jgi:hypothetical protein
MIIQITSIQQIFYYGECSSVGRAPDCGSGCRGFEPHHSPHLHGSLAQLVEHMTFNHGVRGSIPR